jgi:hypothetical protein
LTQINWKDNNNSGAFVERQLRSLQAQIEGSPDVDTKLERLKSYMYIWDTKARIVKNHHLEERIAELERLAGIAQNGVIAK